MLCDAAWLMLAAYSFWFHIGRWHELSRWISQLLPQREALAPDLRLATLIAFWAVVRRVEESGPMDRYTDEYTRVNGGVPGAAPAFGGLAFYRRAMLPILPRPVPRGNEASHVAAAAYDEPGLGPEFGVASDHGFIHSNHLSAYACRLIEHGEFERAAPFAHGERPDLPGAG